MNKLKQLNELGVQQQAIVKELKVGATTVHQWVKGTRFPSKENQQKIDSWIQKYKEQVRAIDNYEPKAVVHQLMDLNVSMATIAKYVQVTRGCMCQWLQGNNTLGIEKQEKIVEFCREFQTAVENI